MALMKLSVAPRVMIVTLSFLDSALPVRCSRTLPRESKTVSVIKPEVVPLLLLLRSVPPLRLARPVGWVICIITRT